MKGIMKKIISALLVLLMLVSLVPTTVFAADQDLYHESADIYVAECISKGICDPYTGVVNGSTQDISMSILHKYMYKLIAEASIEDEKLAFNSVFWNNLQNTIDGKFLEIADWQVQFYTVLIIDYLNYYSQSEEFKSNFVSITTKFSNQLFSSLLNYANDQYLENVDDIIENMSLSEAISFSNKYGYINKLHKYNEINKSIGKVATTSYEYYQHLTKALSVQEANKSRMDFLRAMKAAGSDNYYFIAAVDNVISMFESSYAELALSDSAYTMLDYSVDVMFDNAIEACPALKEILTLIKVGSAGLNWLFNSDDVADNNLKLIILYTINSYAIKALQNLRDGYQADPTEETANTLVNGYLCYLKYQEYASDATMGFISSALFNGMWNIIKNLISNENEMTYEELKHYLQNDIDFCKKLSSTTEKHYDLYSDLLDYDSEIFGNTDTSTELIASGTCGTNLEWSLNSNGILYVWGTGEMTNFGYSNYPWFSYRDSIIEIVIFDGITSIGPNAFFQCINLEYVYIPENILSIGYGAFMGCVNLKDINIPSTVTEIGDFAFSSCDSLENVMLPNSVNIIKNAAFSNCDSLRCVDLPDSIIEIGPQVFSGCSKLEKINLPSNLTSVGEMMFYRCFKLKSISIPNSVITIESNAFGYCTGLTSINIPNSVEELCDNSFYGCENLSLVELSDSVINIGSKVFWNCSKLASIDIPDSVVSIGVGVFGNCINLREVDISNSITEISSSAFYNCDSLSSITIPRSVRNIGGSAFYSCGNLSSVILEDGVKVIGDHAFAYCFGLTRIDLPKSISLLQGDAFLSCSKLSDINVSVDNQYYCSVDGVVFTKDMRQLVSYPSGKLSNVYVIPSGVNSIGDLAFSCCKNIEKVIFSESVTDIGRYAFRDCSRLIDFVLTDNVVSIDTDAFSGTAYYKDDMNWDNGNLYIGNKLIVAKKATIKEGTAVIANNAFDNCISFNSITIPDSVCVIGDHAFYSCNYLTDIYFVGTEEQWEDIKVGRYNHPLINATVHFVPLTPEQDITFSGASLTLQDNLCINFKANETLFTEVGYENPYVVFELNGEEFTVSDYEVISGKYVFDFADIAPHNMNDTVKATLYATFDGVEYVSETREYSVATYCYNMLNKYTSSEYAELQTLLVDLLNYGAMSQIYTNHNTDCLVNADLTDAQKAWGTVDAPTYESVQNLAYKTIENPTVQWKGGGLNLVDAVTMRFKISANSGSYENLVVKAETDDRIWTIPFESFTETTGGYYVYFSGLNAGEMSETVYLTVYENGEAVSNTLSYSIESYVYSKQTSTDTNLTNLLEAMMKYGNSAYNYAN